MKHNETDLRFYYVVMGFRFLTKYFLVYKLINFFVKLAGRLTKSIVRLFLL